MNLEQGDPELGGALAETFWRCFMNVRPLASSQHTTEFETLANELPNIQNANMLFDEKTLLPIFKLVIGQAGVHLRLK